ncbi:hypothetical protein [Bacillus alkalisoli]|uniref:hypothetical protein n=1 Tax=Bacillus alkalisoli TaxID=2011008 RepID=UPI001D0D3150|nr:hypothetical protein [Bacillus alkalisoli]
MEKLILEKVVDYSSTLNYVDGQITRDGTLLLIESDSKELDFFERPVHKHNWTIQMIKGESVETVELKNVPLIPTEIDVYSDGTLLIVQGRCLKEGNAIERNARRYNPNGQLIEAFTLGDGISHMQIDETDTIWVSYFDEGIFGNFGWDEPIGSAGLNAFTMNGHKLWNVRNDGMIDCCALNVLSSKEVYYFYNDDFHLVQLTEMKESFRYRVEGKDSLDQFIIDQSGIIAQLDTYTLMRYRLNKTTMRKKEKLQLVDKDGKQINGPVFMRGTFLYAYGKDGIYRRSL